MNNLWIILSTIIVLILFGIGIVVYESISKGNEYVLKIIVFSLVVIFLIFGHIPYWQDAIENKTTIIIAEYVKHQPGSIGTERLFFINDTGEVRLEAPILKRPLAYLIDGKTYEIEYFNHSKVIKEFRLVE